MPAYTATARAAVANPRTIGRIGHDATAVQRGCLNRMTISVSGTPADNAIIWTLQRCTTTGTMTGVTPATRDTADGAADLIASENATAEPTYTASTEMFDNAINQRATLIVVYDDRNEIIIPATANNGLGLKATHASFTGNSEVTFTWTE
jgi:hypothetical protein